MLLVEGSELLVRHIPHRAASTTAPVDPASIAKRPCFLCEENLPPEQEGLPWGAGFTLLCNPFPVVARHLTIVHREHRPQRIAGLVDTMLELSAELPDFFVVYNGPRCGASAPDHLHLQAGSRDELPIARLARSTSGPAFERWGARALLFRGEERSRVAGETDRALDLLASLGQEPEPWCNVVTFHEAGAGFTAIVFPRTKHRPEVFRTGELTVSPAAIDLSGILVAPVAEHYARLSADDAAAVFREVTLPANELAAIVGRLEGAR